MQRFCIITNGDKPQNTEMIEYIVSFMEKHECNCQILNNSMWQSKGITHYTDVSCIDASVECAIVLGGDGTIIQASIDLVHKDIPILGINTGTLGFLTEVEKGDLEAALEKLIKGEYTIESRIMLKECEKFSEDKSINSCYALNDMVISKRGDCRLITIKVYVNDELADVYRADGLIISTPTGSTGYNLSAGGPVMSPNTHATVVTPICAHSLNKRSLVLDASDRISLEIGQTKSFCEDMAMLTADGRVIGELSTGDTLKIQVPNAVTKLIKLSGVDFYQRMREKLNGDDF